MTAIRAMFAMMAMVGSATAAVAQAAGPVPASLLPATATLGAEFTSVSAVRELPDGRLLIVDRRERALHVADWQSGAVRKVGREGGGVGEYASPRFLFALAGDSTLMPDRRNGRWLLLVRDSIVGAIGADAPAVRALGSSPIGADAPGNAFATKPQIINGMPRLDSLLLLRGTRRNSHVDTVGTLLARPVNFAGRGTIDPTKMVPVVLNPLGVGEQAVVFADGAVAVARLSPYRVAWMDPAGRRLTGPVLPFEAVRVTDGEKRDALAREARPTGREPQRPDEVGEWPAVVPPFLGDALVASTDGTVWIRRAPSAAHPENRYDVVDRSGELVARIVLEPAERIVGFGRASVYTVLTDENGIERLRRHPLVRRARVRLDS